MMLVATWAVHRSSCGRHPIASSRQLEHAESHGRLALVDDHPAVVPALQRLIGLAMEILAAAGSVVARV
jgi:hypothetical protein